MLDPALFRDDDSDVETRLSHRGDGLVERLQEVRRLDAERRAVIPRLEEARHAKKALGAQIGKAKREGQPADELVAHGQQFSETIATEEARQLVGRDVLGQRVGRLGGGDDGHLGLRARRRQRRERRPHSGEHPRRVDDEDAARALGEEGRPDGGRL